jgi:hypothetical protein
MLSIHINDIGTRAVLDQGPHNLYGILWFSPHRSILYRIAAIIPQCIHIFACQECTLDRPCVTIAGGWNDHAAFALHGAALLELKFRFGVVFLDVRGCNTT